MSTFSTRHKIGSPAAASGAAARSNAPPAMSNAMEGVPLDPRLRSEMEGRFGESFVDVRIRNDVGAHEQAASLESKAFTVGNVITFGADRFAPHSFEGKQLLAHELAHVVQQRRGGAAPAMDAHAPHEAAAHSASQQVINGTGPVSVVGATGVGVACDRLDDEEKKEDDDKSNYVVPPPKSKKAPAKSQGMEKITHLPNAKGALAEVTVPHGLYSDQNWNNFAGGGHSGSSRTDVSRQTDLGKGGFDFLTEHRLESTLVIGEQKALGKGGFTDATAITVNLEKNLKAAEKAVRKSIRSGKVDPREVENMKNIADRLGQARAAVKNQTSIPEGIQFELTGLGGKSPKITKNYIDLLARKFGKNPEFMAKLLQRTYVRDPQLARKMKRPLVGKPGTANDPDLIPAKDLMTKDAVSEMQRRLAGKTPKEWKAKTQAEEAARKEQERKNKEAIDAAKKAAREIERAKKRAEKEKLKSDANSASEEARRKKMEELREKAKASGEPKSKTARDKAEAKMRREAREAGTQAKKQFLEEARSKAAEAKKAEAAAKQTAEVKPAEAAPLETKAAPEPPRAPKTAAAAKARIEATPPLQVEGPYEDLFTGPTAHGPTAPPVSTPRAIYNGVMTGANILGSITALEGIGKKIEAGDYRGAAEDTGKFGLGFVPWVAPVMIADGVIGVYEGPRHDQITKHANKAGDVVKKGASYIPLLGRSETFTTIAGGVGAATWAVGESTVYFVGEVGEGIYHGAEILFGGPSIMEMVEQEMKRRQREGD